MSKFIALINVAKEENELFESITSNIGDFSISMNVKTYEIITENKMINVKPFEPMVSRTEEEIKPNYGMRAGRYIRKVGKYSSFVKKSEAINIRTVWEYESKSERQMTQETVEDEDTLIFQESMTVTEEANEWQLPSTPIAEVLTLKEGTNVKITGKVGERRVEKTKSGKEVRWFRINEWDQRVEAETGEVIRFVKSTIWVKPGLKVTMMIGEEYTIHGVIRRMPMAQRGEDLYRFLNAEEINEGKTVFTYLNPARFVKFVPEDITGKTGDVTEMDEQDLIQWVLKGYKWEEIVNPDELETGINETEKNKEIRLHLKKVYGWEDRMVKVTEAKSWLRAKYSGMGGGVEDLLTNVNDIEAYIEDKFGIELVTYMQELTKCLTGSEYEVESYKSEGVTRYGNAEVLDCIEAVEEVMFEDQRKEFLAKAQERMVKHVKWHHDESGTIVLDGGFLSNMWRMRKEDRIMVIKVIKEMHKAADRMKVSLKEVKWTGEKVTKVGELPKVEKVVSFNDGLDWYNNAVKPIAEEAMSKVPFAFRNSRWLSDGLENIASMLMRGDFVPLYGKEIEESMIKMIEASHKIKFYGGEVAKMLWRYFSSWQAIKQAAYKAETGIGHVDEEVAGGVEVTRRKREEQADAEARFTANLNWEKTSQDEE